MELENILPLFCTLFIIKLEHITGELLLFELVHEILTPLGVIRAKNCQHIKGFVLVSKLYSHLAIILHKRFDGMCLVTIIFQKRGFLSNKSLLLLTDVRRTFLLAVEFPRYKHLGPHLSRNTVWKRGLESPMRIEAR